MKVLVFTEQSGTSRYWEGALPLLRARGVEVQLACLKESGALNERMTGCGISSVAFGARNSRDYVRAVAKLARYQEREQFDIIHASESIPAAISGVSALFSTRCVRLFHRHHNLSVQNTRLFDYLAHRTADFIMACSASTARFAIEQDGFDKSKVEIAYNGIAPIRPVRGDEISKLRRELGLPKNGKVISIVARLRKEKGHLTLFRAVDRAAGASDVPLSVVIAGSGYFEEELRREASRYNRFRTYFVGHQDDIAPWFAIANVVAMPSYIEPFGLVAAEAMSCGRPLVASGVDGLLEVVEDGVSGLLVPPRDEFALARAIKKIIENPDLAAELSKNGKIRVAERFSMETMVEGWIRCYSKVMEMKGQNGN